jgi:hypothetical protein
MPWHSDRREKKRSKRSKTRQQVLLDERGSDLQYFDKLFNKILQNQQNVADELAQYAHDTIE